MTAPARHHNNSAESQNLHRNATHDHPHHTRSHCTTHHRNRVVPVVISRRQKGQRSICPVLMHVPQSMWPQTLITMSLPRSMHTWHVVDRLDASSSLFAFDASNDRSSRSCLYCEELRLKRQVRGQGASASPS